MSNIQIVFEMPKQIETGLALGQYERIGGVIRDSQSKHIVMWLQEGGQVDSSNKMVNQAMVSVLQKTGLSSRTAGAILSGSLSTLNIAFSAYTLYRMIERINELEHEIELFISRCQKNLLLIEILNSRLHYRMHAM